MRDENVQTLYDLVELIYEALPFLQKGDVTYRPHDNEEVGDVVLRGRTIELQVNFSDERVLTGILGVYDSTGFVPAEPDEGSFIILRDYRTQAEWFCDLVRHTVATCLLGYAPVMFGDALQAWAQARTAAYSPGPTRPRYDRLGEAL
jgi:hypothetical protein